MPWCRRYKRHRFNKTAGASPRPTTWIYAKLLDGFSTFLSTNFGHSLTKNPPHPMSVHRVRLSFLYCRAVLWCRRYKRHGFNKPAGASPRPTTWVYAKLWDNFFYISVHKFRSQSNETHLTLCLSANFGYSLTKNPPNPMSVHRVRLSANKYNSQKVFCQAFFQKSLKIASPASLASLASLASFASLASSVLLDLQGGAQGAGGGEQAEKAEHAKANQHRQNRAYWVYSHTVTYYFRLYDPTDDCDDGVQH